MIPHLPLSAWIGLAICALAGAAAAAWFLLGQRRKNAGTEYGLARPISYTVREVRAGDEVEDPEPFGHPVERG